LRGLILCLLSCFVFLHVPGSLAAQEVRVGGYHFPPYLNRPEDPQPQGLVPELLQALNLMQEHYRFVLVPTSATRRYRDMQGERFDLMFFESSHWGWQNTPHLALPLDIEDAEVYVAAAEPGRGQEYFQDFSDKRMALYGGYHYGFAGFNADQSYLARTFNALITYSHDSNLRMLQARRVDVVVITRSYLEMYLQRHPEAAADMLVSEHFDQLYQHQVLLRPDGPLTPAQMSELLDKLQADGQLQRLLSRYRLALGGKVAPD
jgi:ABC-type amino acid transport substrate-binding protein